MELRQFRDDAHQQSKDVDSGVTWVIGSVETCQDKPAGRGREVWRRPRPLVRPNAQDYGNSDEELACSSVLLPIVYLLPVGESPGISLVPSHIWCPF